MLDCQRVYQSKEIGSIVHGMPQAESSHVVPSFCTAMPWVCVYLFQISFPMNILSHKKINLSEVGVSKNSGFSPQIIHFNKVFHSKPSILGAHPYFWKHPSDGGRYERAVDEVLVALLTKAGMDTLDIYGLIEPSGEPWRLLLKVP